MIDACTSRSEIITSWLVRIGFEHSAVGIHAGRKQDGVFGSEKLRDLLFQFAMNVLSAADEPDRRHAVAPVIQAGVSRCHNIRMARQTQIIVGTHVDSLFHLRASGKLDFNVGRLSGMDDTAPA